MKRALVLTGLALGILTASATGEYETGSQKLLTLTGNIHAKAVWVRTSQGKAQDYTANSRLVVLDTREGGARILDNEVGVHIWPKITRDGKYVIWNTGSSEFHHNNSSYITPWDGVGGKKLLIDGTKEANPGHVLSTYMDAAGQNFVYAVKVYSPWGEEETPDSVWQIPQNGNAVDLTKKKLVYWQTQCRPTSFNIPSDGKMTALQNPWPNIARYNFETKVFESTCDGQPDHDMACMPYICPDGSGWVTHMEESHYKIHTISPDNKTRTWINCAQGMPGNGGNYDVLNPMWSNHAMFLSAMYPLMASGVHGEFCVGKYTDKTYKAITWVCLTDETKKDYREGLGDLWIDGVATGVRTSPLEANTSSGITTAALVNGDMMIQVSGQGAYSVSFIAPSGRLIRAYRGNGSAQYSLPARELPRGVCLAVLEAGTERLTKTIFHR